MSYPTYALEYDNFERLRLRPEPSSIYTHQHHQSPRGAANLVCFPAPPPTGSRRIPDYLSAANRDIMVIEDGSFVTRYAYDENGSRVSAEFSYAAGTARGTANASGEYGENLQSDIASGVTGKVWYRGNMLGSDLFATDENGNVVLHTIYDAWGKPLTETKTDANLSGLENGNNFTGYTYDVTLELYFAQNRFYDADNHRFTQKDPIESGSNWYVYCGNNPVGSIDQTGEKDVKIVELAADYGATITWKKGVMVLNAAGYQACAKSIYLAAQRQQNSSDTLSATVTLNGTSKTYSVAGSRLYGSVYISASVFGDVYDVFIDDLEFAHDWNYAYNCIIENDPNRTYTTPLGYIEGQGQPNIRDFRYGTDTFENVGCEIIAMYNALNKLGLNQPLSEIANFYESGNPGMRHKGHRGTDAARIGDYLSSVNVSYSYYRRDDISAALVAQQGSAFDKHVCEEAISATKQNSYLDGLLSDKNALILTFWNDNPLYGIHTVTLEKDSSGTLYVHNIWNGANQAYTSYSTVKDFLDERSSLLLSVYVITK